MLSDWKLPGIGLTEQAKAVPIDCGIYGIYNLIDATFYVGSSINIRRRLQDHLSKLRQKRHNNHLLQDHWNTTDESKWHLMLFELCSSEKRFVREQHYIDTRLAHFEGYNRSNRAGKPKAYEWTAEQRKRQSETQLRRFREHPLSLIEKQRLRILVKGRKRPQHECDKIAEIQRGRTYSLETLRRMAAGQRRRFSVPMPTETRRKMSESQKTKVFTKEHKINISKGLQRRWALKKASRG